MTRLVKIITFRITPRPRPVYVFAYAIALTMGMSFLIGSSPTLARLLDSWTLSMWHVSTVLGAIIAMTGVIRGRVGVEIAGLWLILSALLVYAVVLVLAIRSSDNPATVAGLAGLASFAGGLVAARIATEVDGMRTAARIDRVGA